MTIGEKIDRLIRPEIRALKAYHVPDARGLVKLDAMENPYAWPDETKQAWCEVLRRVEINRYPDPRAQALKQRLRASLAPPAGAGLLLGNGSDELIQMILMSVARPAAVVLAPTPTFVMYEMIGTFTGMQFVGVPLAGDFDLDGDAMLAAIRQHQPAVIFLAYPNNPTGNLFSSEVMEAVIDAAPGLVVIDEAYHAFAAVSWMDRLGARGNLLVMRTLSKQGLAGLRLGILAGDPAWLDEFDKVRLPYNVNSLTQASAEFILSRPDILDAQARQICTDRERLVSAMGRLAGIHVWPSRANFILFRTLHEPATAVFEALRAAGVLVKNLDPAGGALRGCLRVTVGTPAENRAFLEALVAAL